MSFKSEATPEHVPYPLAPHDFDLERDENPKSTEPYTRESCWTTAYNERVRIKHLKDTHLVNLIQFIGESEFHSAWERREEFIAVLKEEVKLRALHPLFQERAIIPHQREGRWQIILPDTGKATYLSPDPEVLPYEDMPVAEVDRYVKRLLDEYLKNPIQYYLNRYEMGVAMLYASDEMKREVIERIARTILDPL